MCWVWFVVHFGFTCCVAWFVISLMLVLLLDLRGSLVGYLFGVVLKLGLVGSPNRLLLLYFDCCGITLIVYLVY